MVLVLMGLRVLDLKGHVRGVMMIHSFHLRVLMGLDYDVRVVFFHDLQSHEMEEDSCVSLH